MSTVVLQSIEWDKCFSFGESNKVYLSREPLTQIIAPNGYGKSSIPLILEEALYNKNSKGIKKEAIPNRLLDGKYNIKLDFSIDGEDYSIHTSRASGIKIKLLKNGEDISSHTATNTFKQIEELMGMDFKTFQQLVYQSTNSSLGFLTATDTARKKFLIDLFDLSEYTRLFELFKAEAKEVGSEVSQLEGKLSTINKWMEANSSISLEYLPILDVPEREDYSSELGQLNSKISNIEDINTKILRNNSLKKKLEAIDIDSLRQEDLTEQSYDEYQKEVGTLQSDKTAADNVLKKLKGLEDKCPTCLQGIDKHFYEDLLLQHTEASNRCIGRIEMLQQAISQVKKHNSFIASIKSQIAEYENLSTQIDESLTNSFLDSTSLEEELKSIKARISEADALISRLTKANNDAIKHNSKIDIYIEQNEEFSKQLSETKEELDSLVGKYKNLEVLKKAFSTNGLIAYKLENLVKDLEGFTNEYLAELSDGRFTIEFSISSDKLNVIVTDEGKEISIAAPSSGELARINISTLLAIRRLMSGISKNTINVLFLDEVVSVLDQDGLEKLVEVLLKEDDLNTFVVSHNYHHPLVSRLIIKKEDGISRIDNG